MKPSPMQRRSSSSVKIRSVPRETVITALSGWFQSLSADHPEIKKAGLFGSSARGDYTPSSDVDILLIVSNSSSPMWKRALDYPPPPGPVGAELFIYAEVEIDALEREGSQWLGQILKEVVWLEADSKTD